MLKFPIAGEAEPSNDAHDRGGGGVQALGHGANTEQHVFARMLEDRANDFLPLRAKLLDTLGEGDRPWVGGGCLFHAARELRKTIWMLTPLLSIESEGTRSNRLFL